MEMSISEKLVTKILAVGAAFTTILVVSGSVTDPVNTPKFVSIGVISFAAFGVLLTSQLRSYLMRNKLVLISVSLFICSMLIALFSSKSPFSQNLYGSYGRNNGFITYLFLSLILVSALTLRNPENFEIIIKSLIFAGLVNVAYCLWVIVFGDFIGWSNPYGNILGTLGNPNFIGSFLGIFFTAYLAFGINRSSSRIYKYSLFVVLPITAFEIYESNAIQGRVLAVLGVGVLGFLLIRTRFSKLIIYAYVILGSLSALLALLGALQIGPLSQYIYKTSVSLRGQYWLAGWNTGANHPATGVGMDSFGDWYRRSRDMRAIELPGVNVVVNAAHNVPLDMFAFGGLPLFLTYLLIMSLAGLAAIKLIFKKRTYDPIAAVLVIAWTGYQVQSIISINQIGLAVWGWLLSGCLIAYENTTRGTAQVSTMKSGKFGRKEESSSIQPTQVMAGSLAAVTGLLIALPPLTSDATWRSAQIDRTVTSLENSMKEGYFNPANSYKYLANIQILEGSNMFDLSHKYALEAVNWNPEDFNLWKILYLIQKSTPVEKKIALENMKRLDPLNPDVTNTQ